MDLFLRDVIVTSAFYVLVIVVVAILFNYLNNEKKRRYALMEKAIESGQQIPENFLMVKKAEKRSFEYFKNGIIFIFLGAAFWVMQFFSNFIEGDLSMFVASFFTAFGLAWLLIGILRKIQEKNEEKAKNE